MRILNFLSIPGRRRFRRLRRSKARRHRFRRHPGRRCCRLSVPSILKHHSRRSCPDIPKILWIPGRQRLHRSLHSTHGHRIFRCRLFGRFRRWSICCSQIRQTPCNRVNKRSYLLSRRPPAIRRFGRSGACRHRILPIRRCRCRTLRSLPFRSHSTCRRLHPPSFYRKQYGIPGSGKNRLRHASKHRWSGRYDCMHRSC